MRIEYLPPNVHQADLHLIQFGMEQCAGNHTFGPAMREYYKIHYVLDGEGRFDVAGRTYRLGQGQGFLITPGRVTHYKADAERPWKYCWIGFDGLKASTLLKRANLSDDQPIFDCDANDFFERCIADMTASKSMANGREIRLTGLLYLWIAMLVESGSENDKNAPQDNRKNDYVARVVQFIETNYANKITVDSIARFIGLQRSYLSSLFKEEMNASIREHLISFRMRKACELLLNPRLSVGDIARSVGYDDPLLFSKMFKKVVLASPSTYRSKLNERPLDADQL